MNSLKSADTLEPGTAGEESGRMEDASDFFRGIGSVVSQLDQEQTLRMKALLEVSRRMNATLAEKELLPFMMEKLVELMEADHAYLVLMKQRPDSGPEEPDSGNWEVRVSHSRDPNQSGEASPPSNTLIRRVIETRQPIRVDDAMNEDFIRDSRSVLDMRLQSVMAVPLLTGDRLIGVLSVENRGKLAKFNEEHMDFLHIFGYQAAVAIENARLYRTLIDTQAKLTLASRQLKQELEDKSAKLLDHEVKLSNLELKVRHLDKMAALGTAMSSIAHELNNPIAGALGFAELVESSAGLGSTDRRWLGKITNELRRSAEIIRNLLDFARNAKGVRRQVSINALVAEAIDLKRPTFEQRDITVQEQYDANIPSTLAEEVALRGVLINILGNAADAIREHRSQGQIRVLTQLTGEGQILIEVVDNGGGIREPERIFDPFYTTKAVGTGTGLGMSVAYGVVRSHQGTITARNVDGGACIQILLPVEVPRIETGGPEGPPEPAPVIRSGRLLVVDDETVIRELCQALLEGEGFSVDLASSGREAQRRLLESDYDLIITDIRMPGDFNGVDLYRWLKEAQPERCNRVIFITGDLLTQDVRSALGEVGRRLLAKPFEVTSLIEVVRRTIHQAGQTSDSSSS